MTIVLRSGGGFIALKIVLGLRGLAGGLRNMRRIDRRIHLILTESSAWIYSGSSGIGRYDGRAVLNVTQEYIKVNKHVVEIKVFLYCQKIIEGGGVNPSLFAVSISLSTLPRTHQHGLISLTCFCALPCAFICCSPMRPLLVRKRFWLTFAHLVRCKDINRFSTVRQRS